MEVVVRSDSRCANCHAEMVIVLSSPRPENSDELLPGEHSVTACPRCGFRFGWEVK